MSTLYDVLGIDKDAGQAAIKKGYFVMVRKYPPERFPDKFMEIRSAYETLSNEKTKSEYDAMLGMSSFVRINFERAKELMGHGDHGKAIPMLEELSMHFPDILTVRSVLGEAYYKNGNNVKAIRIYEQLVKDAPDNAGFIGHLANLYLIRGWQIKSIEAYKKAMELDEDNISTWIGLSEAYLVNDDRREARNTLLKSLDHENADNRGSFSPIYFRLALTDIEVEDLNSFRAHLKKMSDIVSEDEEEKENACWALLSFTRQLMDNRLYSEAEETVKHAERLMPHNKDVQEIKKVVEEFAGIEVEFRRFEDAPFDNEFKALVFNKLFPDEDIDDDPKVSKVMKAMDDYAFLDNINSYRKQINTFKESYPVLYSRLKDFLTQALNPALNRKMLNKCEKEIAKNEKIVSSILEESVFDSEDMEDDNFFEPLQPVRREEPKIGRNDPCPCGSGKKYKKCCGKNL